MNELVEFLRDGDNWGLGKPFGGYVYVNIGTTQQHIVQVWANNNRLVPGTVLYRELPFVDLYTSVHDMDSGADRRTAIHQCDLMHDRIAEGLGYGSWRGVCQPIPFVARVDLYTAVASYHGGVPHACYRDSRVAPPDVDDPVSVLLHGWKLPPILVPHVFPELAEVGLRIQ